MREDGRGRRPFRSGAFPSFFYFSLSPTRAELAVCCALNRWTRQGVYVVPLARGRARPLARAPTPTDVHSEGQFGANVTWSPDGRLVAWVATQDPSGYDQVLLAPADGSRKPIRVTHGAGYVAALTFSSDGRRLVFALN